MFLKFAFILGAVLLCSAEEALAEEALAVNNSKVKPEVVCYVGTWAAYRTGAGTYNTSSIDPFACTTIIYSFFGITAEGEIRLTDPWLDLPDGGGKDNIRQFNALKEKNPELKTLAAIGGWNEGSTNFSLVAANPDLRVKFANSTLDFVRKNNFSGADIDWEYPMRRNDLNNNDTLNFNLLLAELKKAFAPYKLLLTAAVSSTKTVASEIYDVSGMVEQLDRIHIMAYDLALGTDTITGFNAPLFAPEGRNNELNVDAILKYWTSVTPANKLILGVPFYGHNFQLKNATENLPGSPSAGAGPAGPYSQEAGLLTYNELCIQWQTQNWTKVFDEVQKVPYAYLDNAWVSYDDPKSIIMKGNLALKYGLAGVMVWSLESDDISGSCGRGKNPLLRALNHGVKRIIPIEVLAVRELWTEPKANDDYYNIYDDIDDLYPEDIGREIPSEILHKEIPLEEARSMFEKLWQTVASIINVVGFSI